MIQFRDQAVGINDIHLFLNNKGIIPKDEGNLVELILRNGDRFISIKNQLAWGMADQKTDILKYRILKS